MNLQTPADARAERVDKFSAALDAAHQFLNAETRKLDSHGWYRREVKVRLLLRLLEETEGDSNLGNLVTALRQMDEFACNPNDTEQDREDAWNAADWAHECLTKIVNEDVPHY